MERISRKERRLVQGARDRIMRDKRCPIEFVCCGACDYLIKVYLGEDGPTNALGPGGGLVAPPTRG